MYNISFVVLGYVFKSLITTFLSLRVCGSCVDDNICFVSFGVCAYCVHSKTYFGVDFVVCVYCLHSNVCFMVTVYCWK